MIMDKRMQLIEDIKKHPKLSKVFPRIVELTDKSNKVVSLNTKPEVAIRGEVSNPKPISDRDKMLDRLWAAVEKAKETSPQLQPLHPEYGREVVRIILNEYHSVMSKFIL